METSICKNCGHTFTDKFCNHCGQKHITDKDKSMGHFLDEVMHFLTHYEGSFIRTFKAVLTKPGQLSLDYCNGKRKTYYKPISFFLLIVVLYLVFPIASGMNQAFSTHLGNNISGVFVRKQVDAKMASTGVSEDVLAEKYQKLSGKTSKVLLLLLIPLSAFFIFILFFTKKKYAFDFLILSTEFNSFMMLAIFVILPILMIPLILLLKIPDGRIDEVMGPVIALIITLNATFLFRRFFGSKWIISFLKAVAFCFVYMAFILPLYQFIIFEVTFALI